MIEGYFRQIDALIAASDIVHSSRVTYDKRSPFIGFIRGEIYFLDGSCLHLREFVDIEYGIQRYRYVYHYQNSDGALIFRYDNTPHFPELPTFPHHKHTGSETQVVAVSAPDLAQALGEIRKLIITSGLVS